MTDEIKKSSAGRKSKARPNDINSLIETAERLMLKADAQACNDLPKLYSLRRDLALGIGVLGKKASITNRKSAIDAMILQAERYATREAELIGILAQESSDKETLPEETKQVANGAPEVVDNLTFEEKKRQWLLDKANKEAEKED